MASFTLIGPSVRGHKEDPDFGVTYDAGVIAQFGSYRDILSLLVHDELDSDTLEQVKAFLDMSNPGDILVLEDHIIVNSKLVGTVG